MENPLRHCWTVQGIAIDRGALARMALLFWLWLFPFAGAAQANPRDYSVSPPRVSYSEEGAFAVVSFTVSNQGGDASGESRIVVSEYQSGRVASTEPLPALPSNQERQFSIQLPLANLRSDGIISFKIEAGIDEFELANSPIARDNSQLFHLDRSAAGGDFGPAATEATYDLFVPIINLGVNFLADGIQLNESRYSGVDILLALALLAVALFCLWLLSLILRLLFRRPPKFDPWQPPYALNNWHDPNSDQGRRQSWQYHAQSSVISARAAQNQVTVVKRLLDRRGHNLGSWKVKAMRTAQYDVYGRVNRSEALMPRKLISQLNRVIRRAPGYASHELHKAIAPIAKGLGKNALAPVDKQNLMLPIALDIRFEGVADEILIQFELYQYRDGAWHLIDQWAPALGQAGERVPEHFTFSLNGQLSGESAKEFKRRLRDDIARLLAGLFHHHQADEGAAPGKPDSETDSLTADDGLWDDAPLNDDTDARSLPLS